MSELKHYGVKGMKKGVSRWRNPDGSLNAAGKVHYGINGNANPNTKSGSEAFKGKGRLSFMGGTADRITTGRAMTASTRYNRGSGSESRAAYAGRLAADKKRRLDNWERISDVTSLRKTSDATSKAMSEIRAAQAARLAADKRRRNVATTSSGRYNRGSGSESRFAGIVKQEEKYKSDHPIKYKVEQAKKKAKSALEYVKSKGKEKLGDLKKWWDRNKPQR